MNTKSSIAPRMVAVFSAIVLFDLGLATRRLYATSGAWQVLLSALTILIAIFGAWLEFYRQQKQVRDCTDSTTMSRILRGSLGMVVFVNMCALGAIGLTAR